MGEKYRYTQMERMEQFYMFCLKTTVVVTLMLLAAWKLYQKYLEMNHPTYKIPTRRSTVVAENSLVLNGTDLELRKMEYINRKRGSKYPATHPAMGTENMETMPQTPADQSFVPMDEQMSVSDFSICVNSKAPAGSSKDFVFPAQQR